MDGINTCIERMVPDEDIKDAIVDELQIYKTAERRLFSSALCVKRRNTSQPGKNKLSHLYLVSLHVELETRSLEFLYLFKLS